MIVKTEQELLDAIANASGPTVIRIEGTVTIAKTLVIDGGRQITPDRRKDRRRYAFRGFE